jgi:hypothetical protein
MSARVRVQREATFAVNASLRRVNAAVVQITKDIAEGEVNYPIATPVTASGVTTHQTGGVTKDNGARENVLVQAERIANNVTLVRVRINAEIRVPEARQAATKAEFDRMYTMARDGVRMELDKLDPNGLGAFADGLGEAFGLIG